MLRLMGVIIQILLYKKFAKTNPTTRDQLVTITTHIPRCSMLLEYLPANVGHKNEVNAGTYSIHGVSGVGS